MDVTKVKVDHPKFHAVLGLDLDSWIVGFKTGYYIDPPPEAVAASKRIAAALKGISDSDLALLREWGGNVVIYSMNSQLHNPVVTEEEEAEFIAAAKAAFPNAVVTGSWKNAMHGVEGFSVRMHRKKENKQ